MRKATEKTGIKATAKDIETILFAIRSNQNFWQIVRNAQKPIPLVAEVVKILKQKGLLSYKDRKFVEVTQKFEKLFKFPNLPSVVCENCEGRGIDPRKLDIYEEFLEVQRERPKSIQKYDQGYITPESTVSRVAFMIKNLDVAGKEIVILGDDDLVGIALGLTRLPSRVLVLDIDKRLIDFTNSVAKEKNLPVEAEVFDLLEPLPQSMKGRFDVFLSDPPEAQKPFRVFLEKGIWCLRGPGSAGYVGMTLIDSSLSKWRELQKIIIGAGAVITDIRRDFNIYEIWDYHPKTVAWKLAPVKSPLDELWYTSALVRFELVTKPKAKNVKLSLKEVYVDKESTTT